MSYANGNNYNYIEGTILRFYTREPFTSIDGIIVNPDNVTFTYEVQGQTPVTYQWVNPTGDPTQTIQNPDTGYFYCDIQTSDNAGTWTWQWACFPSSGEDVTATEVINEGEVIVSISGIN